MNELTAMRETATDATVEQVRTASRCILICWQLHNMYINDIVFIAKSTRGTNREEMNSNYT